MKQQRESIGAQYLRYSLLAVFFLIPLVFSQSLYKSFEIPKVVVLHCGAALLFLWWWLLPKRRPIFDLLRFSAILPAVLLVFVIFGVASLFSMESTLSFFGSYDRRLGLVSIAALTGLFVVLLERIQNAGQITSIVRVMNISGAVTAAYALAQYFSVDPFSWSESFGNRPASTVGHPNYLGDLLAMTLPLCLALVYGERQAVVKGAWIVCFLLQAGGLLVSQTRGAWIAAFVTIPLFVAVEPFLHRHNRNDFLRHVCVSGAALGALLVSGTAVFWSHDHLRERAASIARLKEQPRLYLWRDSLGVIESAPVLGIGPETFRIAFLPHKSMELARLEPNTNYDSPHNNYLHVWAVTGTLGLGAYLYFLFCCFKAGIHSTTDKPGWLNPVLSLGLLTSLGAYALAMLTGVETITTMVYLYVLAALLAALEAQGKVTEYQKVRTGWGRGVGASVIVFIVAMTAYDSTRMVKADHRVLAGLRTSRNATLKGVTESRILMEEAAALFPRESFYRLQAGVAALTAGFHAEDGKEAFSRAIVWGERSFRHAWAPENSWNLISTAYLNLGEWDEAEQACRRGLALDPLNIPLTYNLAKALALSGRKEEALTEVETILAIDASSVEAQRLKDWLMR